MVALHRRVFLRDAGVALGLYVLLLAAMRLQFQPLQIPGYLLVLGFDAIQNPLAPGLGGGAFQVAFGGYLVGLAAIAAAVAGRLRGRFGPAGPLRYGLAGAVMGFVVYVFAVFVAMLPTVLPASWSPVAIAIIVGLLGLWAGSRVASWTESVKPRP